MFMCLCIVYRRWLCARSSYIVRVSRVYFTLLLFCALLSAAAAGAAPTDSTADGGTYTSYHTTTTEAEQRTLISFHHIRLELDKFHFCSSLDVHRQFFFAHVLHLFHHHIFFACEQVYVCVQTHFCIIFFILAGCSSILLCTNFIFLNFLFNANDREWWLFFILSTLRK